MARLGGIEINVTQESPQFSSTVPERPVEEGFNISDNIKLLPVVMTLPAVIVGPDWQQKYNALKALRDNKEIILYEGILETLDNVVIQQISPLKSAEYDNGFKVDISIKQIKVSRSATSEIYVPVDPVTGDAMKDVQEMGDLEITKENAGLYTDRSLLSEILSKKELLEYVPVTAEMVPCNFSMVIDDKKFYFKFRYNPEDFYTVTITDEQNNYYVLERKLIFGQDCLAPPLSTAPSFQIIPSSQNPEVNSITPKNFGKDTKLYIIRGD